MTEMPLMRNTIQEIIKTHPTEEPLYVFDPMELEKTYNEFNDNFNGMVTFAVKSNPHALILEKLLDLGIKGFDVASIAEIELTKNLSADMGFYTAPDMHYNNPIRSDYENSCALSLGVRSFVIDSYSELFKLAEACDDTGISTREVEATIRFYVYVPDAAGYDFSTKFGANADKSISLLKSAADLGFQLAITSHPGSQCKRAETFAIYMKTARDIVVSSGLVYDVKRMNVGGGFPIGFPLQEVDTFDQYMSKIEGTTAELSKSGWTPDLICEPGRGMVASCVSLITQVKAIKEDGRIYINDGKYGAFEECRTLKLIPKFEVVDHEGNPKTSTNTRPRSIFGPTCDSDDVMPYELDMPLGLMPGDHIVFYNMGSYGSATTTDFNGYCSRDYVDLRGY